MTAPVVTAGTAAYLALDAAYRAAVARQSIRVARRLLFRWTSVDAEDLAGTAGGWLDSSVADILGGQTAATQLANEYTLAVRRLSLPDAPAFTPPPPRPPNVEQIRRSVEFMAIRTTARELVRLDATRDDAEPEQQESAQRSYEGRRDQLMRDAIKRAAGAAVRHVTTAGHGQLEDNVRSDTLAIGWARTTKPGSCYFCAMLASRGYVYEKESFAESNARFAGIGEQKVHDNCGCGLRPIYNPADPKPDRMEALEQLWADSGANFSGQRAINAFRKAYAQSELSAPLR